MADQTNVGHKSKGKRSESPLLHHESLKENWLDGIDISSSPIELVDYISLKYDEYMFTEIRLPTLQGFRKLLRQHGIYVRKTKVSCSIAIAEALNSQYREWTKSEVEEIIKDKTFSYVSGKLQYIKEQIQTQNTFSSTLPTPSMIPTPMNIDTPSPKQFDRSINPNQTIPNVAPHESKHLNFNPNPSNPQIHIQPSNNLPSNTQPHNNYPSNNQQLGILSKLYNEDMKYSGEEANFDFKLTIFFNTCQRAGLPENSILLAFPIML
ncbi:hypothetical protein EV44_g3643 [Erysiphe necator]|uniref:Uncharacterized protein n=1 Tax=Uncinula necator TaxID=52586 RepID=A0A0B1PAF4_UNCNE|nr:hypothetical protein EV44_g3643 [Erysiphe necator]